MYMGTLGQVGSAFAMTPRFGIKDRPDRSTVAGVDDFLAKLDDELGEDAPSTPLRPTAASSEENGGLLGLFTDSVAKLLPGLHGAAADIEGMRSRIAHAADGDRFEATTGASSDERPELADVKQKIESRKAELREQIKDPEAFKDAIKLYALGFDAKRVRAMANLELEVIEAFEERFNRSQAAKGKWENILGIALMVRDGIQVPQERKYIAIYQRYALMLDRVLKRYLKAVDREDAPRVNDDADKTPGYMLWQASESWEPHVGKAIKDPDAI
ncbi:MAG: hypothetical protein VKJ04_06405 [Vampirovibrionales bacterium]|nr:hypothetical protein [Vampirovibrionales bacterium]